LAAHPVGLWWEDQKKMISVCVCACAMKGDPKRVPPSSAPGGRRLQQTNAS
jgi:hypothetical protein